VPPANSLGWAKRLSQDTTQAPQQNRDSSASLLIRSGCTNKALTEPVGAVCPFRASKRSGICLGVQARVNNL
jgi:hypothetical protein